MPILAMQSCKAGQRIALIRQPAQFSRVGARSDHKSFRNQAHKPADFPLQPVSIYTGHWFA